MAESVAYEETVLGSFSFMGSIEITQSLNRVEYARQSSVVRTAIQKLLNIRVTEKSGSRSSSPENEDFIGETHIPSEKPCDIKIIKNMIQVISRGELLLCHHFNCISLSMVDNTYANVFCYLANGSIRTRGQSFETVTNPRRQLYIFQCASREQAREIATAMDRRFKPKSYTRPKLSKVNSAPPLSRVNSASQAYLDPFSDKVQIPLAPVSVGH